MSYPEFFNDVFGPIMQPGSSSHTAGPCRIGCLARDLLGESPREVRVTLDAAGSFAGTFGVMAEDRAMLAGAMGFLPDDERLFDAYEFAGKAGIIFSVEFGKLLESRHPNAVKFVLAGPSGRAVSLIANSTGGGMIETCLVDGCPLSYRGDSYLLLVFDPGRRLARSEFEQVVAGLVGLTEIGESEGGSSPAQEASEAGRQRLYFARLAESPDLDRIGRLLPGYRIAQLHPVLPVLAHPARKPQLFDTMVRWHEVATERGLSLWETAVQYELDASAWPRDRVIGFMQTIQRAMHRQTHAVYEENLVVSGSPFRPDMAGDWARHMSSPKRLTDDLTSQTVKWAYGAGAGIPGVPVVAGPMGSGGGYVYAALYAVKEAKGFSEEDLLRGLFIAAGVGAIAFSRTEPTGEVIGCTGECGICGAMAAAGIAEMAGGRPEEVESAASLLLQAVIGMPCDPITGGAGQPCRSRILTATCMAHIFADLALAGRDAVLPLHEVLDVADEVGRGLPAGLLCTGRAGAAATPAARRKAIAFREWFEETARVGAVMPPGNLI
jgi:L-serine dehydratase